MQISEEELESMMNFAWRKGYESALSEKVVVKIVKEPCNRNHYPPYPCIHPRPYPYPKPYPHLPPFKIYPPFRIQYR